MKKIAWLLLLAAGRLRRHRDDYASQWPLALERDEGGAYRVVLDRDVYRQVHRRGCRTWWWSMRKVRRWQPRCSCRCAVAQ